MAAASLHAQTCALYPIALPAQALVGRAPGDVLPDVFQGQQSGNFGWLTWAGSPGVPTLVVSLSPPGNSDAYVNPDNSSDHQINAGDWVQGKPGVSNSKNVRDALDALKLIDIVVPVWNETRGQGQGAAYRVSAFARIRLLDYHLPGQNRITARFLGYEACDAVNEPPVVSAGSDQTITLPASASLNGKVSDDGLPVGAPLTIAWSRPQRHEYHGHIQRARRLCAHGDCLGWIGDQSGSSCHHRHGAEHRADGQRGPGGNSSI